MITGFEKETAPLSDYEMDTILPVMVRCLSKKRGKDNAVTNKKIVKGMKAQGYDIDDIRVRKLISHIRTNDLIPCLIASNSGYYIAADKVEVQDYIDSLQGRESAIRAVREAMERQIKTISQSPAPGNHSLF